MLVVSDTSPITNLIQIEQLDILKQVFKKVIIPKKVYEELAFYENQKEEIDNRDWIVIMSVKNQREVKGLEKLLDLGEAEAIVLAKELKANLLIVDERKGRKVAQEYGLEVVGLLGVLIQGKLKGFLRELKPILDKLIHDKGFRISTSLYNEALKVAHEK